MDFSPRTSSQTSAFKSPALRRISIEVAKVGGINLAQGVCQLPVPGEVLEAAHRAALAGTNLYTNPRGLLSLREALVKKFDAHNGIKGLDPEQHVLVTCGATGAFEAICAAFLNPGDEVVVFEPSYPYHMQALRRYQANIKVVPLRAPTWEFDEEELARAITPNTKFVLANTPNNPTGKLFSREELLNLGRLIEGTNAFLVTDEIYEYMTFNGAKHVSAASLPELQGRVLTVGGYSKTFSITGWRIGYLVVPASISALLTSVIDAIYVCAPAPLQQAVADGINLYGPEFYEALSNKYERKRDFFANGLIKLGFTPNIPKGAYYMIASYEGRYPELSSAEFVNRMIAEAGVGAVPSEDFVGNPELARWVRFCLAVEDSVLESALERLQQMS